MTPITKDIRKAAALLKQEEVVAIPTETVYGLAGNIFSEKAVRKIFSLKERPLYNPLIVHLASARALPSVAREVPAAARKLAQAFWPGPLTLVLPKTDSVPDLVTAGKPTVAVRVPAHPVARSLLEQLDFPLAAPSANPFGAISPTVAVHVAAYFGQRLSLVLDGGPCQRGIESTIVGFEGEAVILYRHGSLSREEIEQVVGNVSQLTRQEHAPAAPGMLAKHYSPATPTVLTSDLLKTIRDYPEARIGLIVFRKPVAECRIAHQEVLSPSGDLEEAARNLFAAMHRLDQMKLDVIIAEKVEDQGLGKAINDRLSRASA
jgi:L-threonylcarbamoyladenylate synthase